MYYTLDWEIEYECQTNVITPHPTWELGALLILPNHLVSQVIGKNTLTHGIENKTWRKKVAGSSPPPDVDQRKDTSDTSVGSKCVYDHSTDVFRSSHESKKSTIAEGDSIDTTSQHETLYSDAMDLIVLDSHGMDVVALGGAVDAGQTQHDGSLTIRK